MVDRSRIEELVRSALGELAPARVDSGGGLLLSPDRGANLATPYDAPAMRKLLLATPARIAVGRAGTRYRTNTLLRFRADHAAAKDAVLSEVDPKLIERLGLLEIRTRAESKAHFLQRPDAGRALSDEARAELPRRVPSGAQVMIVYGDGLSAAAINQHLEAFHGALGAELTARGIRSAPACFVRYSRVKVMDEICRLVGAEACVFVCGERPGLGFADSLSAYYIYRPPSGIPTDADREVISNINPRGLAPVAAAGAVAEACARVLRDRKSGVVIG
ncbi:MAG: ethanolamine ammonia-lyase subunit EutC [Myxococcales bacterium]|nr:ethanolamine ammonia-lyase subunit EutC [Myxococcales bacterium]